MAEKLRIEKDLVLTGGGARNMGLVKVFEDRLGFRPMVPPEPLLTRALGAAFLGRELVQKALQKGEPLKTFERYMGGVTFFT